MLNRNMPENIYHSLQEAVKDVFGENAEIVKTERMHGGDINEAYRVRIILSVPGRRRTSRRKSGRTFTENAGSCPRSPWQKYIWERMSEGKRICSWTGLSVI